MMHIACRNPEWAYLILLDVDRSGAEDDLNYVAGKNETSIHITELDEFTKSDSDSTFI